MLINDDFLEHGFTKTYNLIIMNPPWTKKLGIKFIDKATKLLVPGGKLVCVMGLDQFSPHAEKTAKEPGTFWSLLQQGSFDRIETRRADGLWGAAPGFFGNSSSIWFIWEKGEVGKTIIINNKTNDEFLYSPTGDEFRIPEFAAGDMDIFDYKNGIHTKATDKPVDMKYKFKQGEVVDMSHKTGKGTYFLEEVDRTKTEAFLEKYLERITLHYAGNITGAWSCPPIKRELLIK